MKKSELSLFFKNERQKTKVFANELAKFCHCYSGSYKPSAFNTLTRGTVRHGTVQGHTAGQATRAALCESTQT
jgi:hypothetical protein